VRAEAIQPLLLGAVPAEAGHVAAVRLHGARVTGELRLAYAQVSCPVRLRWCHLDSPVDLYAARLRQLNLGESALAGLNLGLATIEGNLRLIGCRCTGAVRLTGTHVSGAVQLEKARLVNPGGVALLANRLTVGDDLLFGAGTALGEVRLAGAQVGGMVDLNDARLDNPGRRALTGFRLRVGAYLRGRGCTVEGEVTLVEAAVTGTVDLAGAQLRNPGADALAAMGITVGGVLDLCNGFAVDGAVRLAGARITGPLCLRDAQLANPGKRLVNPGRVALDARHVRARELDLRAATSVEGAVDLRHARFDVIHDDPDNWPAAVHLDGLVYGALDPPLAADRRLTWLARDAFHPHAYEQLAAAYRRTGDEAEARTVLLATQRQRHRHRTRTTQIWGQLQDITVGYGYRPLRAAGWLLLLLAVGTVTFGLHPPLADSTSHLGFNPLIYSLDLLLPIIDFGQEHAFIPDGWRRWIAYLLIATGWILATTIAAGLTRTLRRN